MAHSHENSLVKARWSPELAPLNGANRLARIELARIFGAEPRGEVGRAPGGQAWYAPRPVKAKVAEKGLCVGEPPRLELGNCTGKKTCLSIYAAHSAPNWRKLVRTTFPHGLCEKAQHDACGTTQLGNVLTRKGA
jgi:hypothetical protein